MSQLHTNKGNRVSVVSFPLQSGFAACSPVSVKSGDRFIPTRAGSNWSINFHYANVSHTLFEPLFSFKMTPHFLIY